MPAAEIFAVASALAFALTNIFVKNALRAFSSPFSALITVSSAMAALAIVSLSLGGGFPSSTYAVALFALRGVLDPGISALLVFVALRKIGVSITVPIIAASSLLSTALSIILLKELLTAAIILGTLLIVGGVTALSVKKGKANGSIRYVGAAVLASAAIGAANVITKLALNSSNTPISGMAVAFAAAAAFQLLVVISLRKWKEVPLKLNLARGFAIAGLFAAAAFTLMLVAFGKGNVTVVGPLLSTQPLFTLILSIFLLKEKERITRNIVLGTAAIVAGAVILSAA
ncbi:DMT family transporter [Candidatus Woesearchaeota archaeon]|nr:DMT family transporter [Candidatus Woesearchaeota archaeon]